ncbi:MAG TPA: hypothetical protein VKK31_03915 [Thermoanaerobaculia bacterium]|nr:hypothetical protein [Thermoanaerobaculia bacterium]
MKLNRIVVALLGFAAASVLPARAEVQGWFTPGGSPVVRQATSAVKVALPTFGLILPFYVVDTSSPIGVTTLMAVRNTSNTPIGVSLNYRSADSLVILNETLVLASRETVTRNFRDLVDLPITNGALKSGVVEVTARDPVTSLPVAVNLLTGDYFYVDFSNNFSSGDVLINGTDGFCERWDTRFFNGGAFSGGTVFTFTTLHNPTDGLPHVIATGDVYTEPGGFVGTVTVTSNRLASQIGSVALGLPIFGTVEWFLPQGPGAVGITFNAEGRFSVGMSGFCLD